METIQVVATTPLGAELDAGTLASNVQVAVANDIRDQRAISLAEFMNRNFSSVFVNDAQNNPLQPDVQYRGYVGSPLLGLPQGIAVYQDGVRVNEPFGDTVNWALIPDSAIDTVYLMPGSNPLFGLNALGGAISIRTKSGFSHPGTSVEIYGGSFSRAGLDLETGGSIDDRLSYFVSASRTEEDGWRDYSPTDATQLFANLGWRSARSSIDVNLTRADTDLIGNGPTPVELLESDREAIFTRPDRTVNDLMLLNVSGTHRTSGSLTLTGNLYARDSDITTLNGDDSDFEECESAPGLACEHEDAGQVPARDSKGEPIVWSDAIDGATINRTGTQQAGFGVGVQAAWSGEFAGRESLLTVGLAYDVSDIRFHGSTELGALDSTRLALPAGVFDGESFTRLHADLANSGVYLASVVGLTDTVTLHLSGRYNDTRVTLEDQLGTALNGAHRFGRFNPAAGLTVDIGDELTFYASYKRSNRTPSPVELTCADPDDPCRLPNAFLADPPLQDVVAETVELGLRGSWDTGHWQAGAFRTTNARDILFISAGALTNQGYFDNVGTTRRLGIELALSGSLGARSSWFANYTALEPTFRESFTVVSPENPAAVDGELRVEQGDRLPLIPEHLLKAGLQIQANPRLSLAADVLAASDVFFRGDESNLSEPVSGYATLNLRGEFSLSGSSELFVSVHNVLDSEHETFGLFGEASDVLGDAFQDSRFLSPGPPRAVWAGIRARF